MGSEMMGMIVDARAFPVSTFSKDFGGVEFLEGFSLTLLPMKSRTRHASRMPMQGVGMLHTISPYQDALLCQVSTLWNVAASFRHEALRINNIGVAG